MLVSRIRYFVLLVHLYNPCHAHRSGNMPEEDECKKFHERQRNLACDRFYVDKRLVIEINDRYIHKYTKIRNSLVSVANRLHNTKNFVIDSQTGRPQNRDYLHRDGGWRCTCTFSKHTNTAPSYRALRFPIMWFKRQVLCYCARLCEQKTSHARIVLLVLRSLEARCIGRVLSLPCSIALPTVTLLVRSTYRIWASLFID